MKKKLFTLTLVLSLLSPTFLFAWGREGHHMVVELAYQFLSADAKQKLTSYLGGMSIEGASTWMDDMRRNPTYSYLEHTHYINIEKGGTLNTSSTDNIYWELNKVMDELNNPKSLSTETIKLDILILIHLIGDLHQPLHDGYGDDKGGNDIHVSYLGQQSNLHSVWDSKIISTKQINLTTINSFGSRYSAQQIESIKKANIEKWMMDSRDYLNQVYSFQNGVIDESYIDKSAPIVEEQIYKAGIRLSGLLEKYLSKVSTTTPEIVTKVQKDKMITAAEAANHIGETITVCDKVYGTKYLESSATQPTFLNLGAAYPNSPFTVVIYGNDRPNFKEKPEIYYDNKNVCVTSLIKEYKGKPEMVIGKENEIKVVKE